ncbi:MAG: YraN family protein [Bacteroidia bacterium]
MAAHNELGIKGEDLAVEWLEKNKFEILERNWKSRFEEIDVIAKKDGMLVIIEVKTRSSRVFGNPEESINLRKQRNLVQATESYIINKNSHLETRFDIISIILNKSTFEIQHIPYAFSPFD